ncbi:MAG: hypothetical protein J6A03_02760 [Lachnospiraceae bacterium]|nr:hypothetical protein [Lachnospiraceae bacterium]
MSRSRKLCALLLACMLCMVTGCGKRTQETTQEKKAVTYDNGMDNWKSQVKAKELTCWYTSDADKTFLENAAQGFQDTYGIQVKLVYYDGVSLFEDMNQANQKVQGPDVYIMGNDQLEYAVSSGMAEENTTFDEAFWQKEYPDTAKKALTYKNKQYGYPVYFDTYCLVYDANLLENAPASIDDILAFLDEYEDTGSTKAVFRWDVADPYVNTMFLASYANLFGENGDESGSIEVNNEQCVAAMQYFQSLSAYLWMNKNNISHDTIMNRIKDGTLVLGLCKSDILPTLYEMQGNGAQGTETADPAQEETTQESDDPAQEEASQDGGNTTEDSNEEKNATNYQIAYVPSLTAELSSTTLSTTYGAFVNPYGNDTAAGNLFAFYLSYACSDQQYAGNGKLPVRNLGDGFDSMQSVLYAQYLNSKPVPKVMVLGDYLVDSGIAFDAIWDGQDAAEQLNWLQTTLEEKIK